MGLFDQSYGALLDPQTSGILSAAFSGLEASGPSRMPVSLGQVFGHAGNAGLNAYRQAQQQAATQSLLKMHGALYQAQINKMNQQAEMTRQMMSGGFGGNVSSMTPDRLEMMGELALANHVPGGATYLRLAQQKRAQAENAANLSQMRESPGSITPEGAVAGTNFSVPNIPPQDLPAFQSVARSTAMGQPATVSPEAVPLGKTGGLFAPFLMSSNPAIRRQALALQTQLNNAPDSMPAKYWEDKAASLANSEASIAARPQEPLVPVRGPEGKITYAERSNAVGKEVGSAASPTPQLNEENKNLHGEDYLSILPAGLQQTVRGLITYQLPLTALSSRTGERNAIFQHALQADPNFNVAKYTQRQKVMNDFTSGLTARNIVSIDQSINHMGTLTKLTDALENKDIPAVNAIVNEVRTQTGDPRVNNFDTAKQAVGTELMRVFRQVSASEVETKAWEDRFRAAQSPAQIKGAIKVAGDLLVGRLDAINNQWNRGMEVDTGYPKLLSPEAAMALERFGGKKPGESKGSSSGGSWTDEKERRYQELLRKHGS